MAPANPTSVQSIEPLDNQDSPARAQATTVTPPMMRRRATRGSSGP